MEYHPVTSNSQNNPQSIIKDCPDFIRYGKHNNPKYIQNSSNNQDHSPSVSTSSDSHNDSSTESSLNDSPSPLSDYPLQTMARTPRFTSTEFKLTHSQVNEFQNTGVLIVRRENIWNSDEMKLLLDSVNLMDNWPDAPGKYMKYYETSKLDQSKILCRIENFNQYNPGLSYFCNGQKLIGACTQLFNEPAILYKEKINYKLPGSAGFVPHQDVAAGWWMYGQSLHISVLVCVDAATLENGCLEVALGQHNKGMLSDPWTELSAETTNSLQFEAVPTKPGDVIFFDSYVPHRSEANKTNKPRRVLYATYAKSKEGDFRERYYADKRESYPPDCERKEGKKYEYKV